MKTTSIPKPIVKGSHKVTKNIILEADNKKKELKDNFNGIF